MVKLTVLYGHPTDAAAFEKYHAETHTPIAKQIKTLRRFELAKTVGAPDGSKAKFYRSADLYFDDLDHLRRVLASPEGRRAANDLGNFATGGVTVMVSEVQEVA
jgi:uncharacterized protein (TIGR02118 family)